MQIGSMINDDEYNYDFLSIRDRFIALSTFFKCCVEVSNGLILEHNIRITIFV